MAKATLQKILSLAEDAKLLDALEQRLEDANDDEPLDRAARCFGCLRRLEYEIAGGGFHSFVANAEDEVIADLTSVLLLIGAKRTLRVIDTLACFFSDSEIPALARDRQKWLSRLTAREDARLDQLTKRYVDAAAQDDLRPLLVAYLRANREAILAAPNDMPTLLPRRRHPLDLPEPRLPVKVARLGVVADGKSIFYVKDQSVWKTVLGNRAPQLVATGEFVRKAEHKYVLDFDGDIVELGPGVAAPRR